MKHFTNKEMADMNDDKWMTATAALVHGDLIIDVRRHIGCSAPDGDTAIRASRVNWHTISMYRLHNSDHYKDGIAIDNDTLKADEKKPVSTYDKLIALLNNNEAMEAIALAACEEQQKVIDKANLIQAAFGSLSVSDDSEMVRNIVMTTIKSLSRDGYLTLPGESE